MIELHRLTHPDEPFYLNPDQIHTIEAKPDTVVALDNATKFLVIESPEEVVARVRSWKASILAEAAATTSPARVYRIS